MTKTELKKTELTETELTIVENEEGEVCLEFPPAIMEDIGWSAGDDIKFTINNDRSFTIRKVKLSSIELDVEEEELAKWMVAAHEANMSFNEWVQYGIESAIATVGEADEVQS